MKYLYLQILIALAGIYYYILLGKKKRVGWAYSFFTHCLEVTILILSSLWIFAGLKIIHTCVAGFNWRKWKE